MSRAWVFLHLLGFTMWLGGAIASMIMGIAAKREDRHGLGAVVRAQGSLMKMVIAPGALLAEGWQKGNGYKFEPRVN